MSGQILVPDRTKTDVTFFGDIGYSSGFYVELTDRIPATMSGTGERYWRIFDRIGKEIF